MQWQTTIAQQPWLPWFAGALLLGLLASLIVSGLWARGRLRRKDAALQEAQQQGREREHALVRAEAQAQMLREQLDVAQQDLHERMEALSGLGEQLSQARAELAAMQAEHAVRQAGYEEQIQAFSQARQQWNAEFRHLANQILEEKGQAMASASRTGIESMLQPFREQIQAFQQRVNQVHDESLKGTTLLGRELQHIQEIGLRMSAEADTLARALKGDKKTAGIWGEAQLEQTLQLAGLVRGQHYDAQVHARDAQGQSRLPDFVVRLPDDKHIIIDSKVSLVDYTRYVSAQDEQEREQALAAHIRAVRAHMDDLARKDYPSLSGMHSPSFVLMYMPIEPAFIDAMRHGENLFDHGYRRNVVLVSHTTLLPVLKTVANVWMLQRSHAQAHELGMRAGEIYNQVCLVAERLKKLGDALDLASRQYNLTVTAVAGQQGLHGKVARFGELSVKATRSMPDIQPLHADFESERLGLIAPADDESDGKEEEPPPA